MSAFLVAIITPDMKVVQWEAEGVPAKEFEVAKRGKGDPRRFSTDNTKAPGCCNVV